MGLIVQCILRGECVGPYIYILYYNYTLSYKYYRLGNNSKTNRFKNICIFLLVFPMIMNFQETFHLFCFNFSCIRSQGLSFGF